MTLSRIKVGISSCLLGQQVRYDGGHKLSALCAEDFASHFELVPTCPEAGAGLGVPRPPVQLRGNPLAPRAVRIDEPSIDVTGKLQAYAATRLPELADLCGYILIRNSPSCGLFEVPVHDADGVAQAQRSRGIFAAALIQAYPLLPVEEEGRLQDFGCRESFITRVYALHDWRALQGAGLNAAVLTGFHARHKYTVMAHSPQQYRELGQMLAEAGKHNPDELGARYIAALLRALEQQATRGTHTNVLMHLQGYLRTRLNGDERSTLTEVIERYQRGEIPLHEPILQLRRHFERHPDPYIDQQTYLRPHPGAPQASSTA